MLSLKRLIYVLLIVFGICGIFILYNINENNNRTVKISNKIVEEKELLQGDSIEKSGEPYFYVAGNEEKDIYKDIYSNVCQLMADMKVSWEKTENLSEAELKNKKAVIIFCDDIVNEYVELPLLAQFIENGGKVIFAAGIAEGYEDSYLLPIQGVVEKTIKENYQNYNFLGEMFPLQEEQMTYSGYTASTWMTLREKATVYVEDSEKKVPIVYTYPYGQGESFVINATFLSDSSCMGFLSSGIGILLDDFVYPVLGTECVYLDNFPIVTYVNDPVCMKLYGRTTEAFVRDVVWPVFQGMSVRNELKYTSSVLSVASDEKAFPAISESLFNTMGKSALQYEGEMAYAADCVKTSPLYENKEFIESFQKTFENYDISALVMMSEKPIKGSIEVLGKEIQAVRGKLEAENSEERMLFSEEYYVFPEATQGTKLEEGSMLEIASVLTSHGMVSHTFDINQLISIDENSPTWDEDKIKLEEFEEKVIQKTDYLSRVTLSETKNLLKSYQSLEYTWKKNGENIEIYADKFIEGQPFFLRTERRITEAENAEYKKIGDNYYIVYLKASKAVLTMEKGEGE